MIELWLYHLIWEFFFYSRRCGKIRILKWTLSTDVKLWLYSVLCVLKYVCIVVLSKYIIKKQTKIVIQSCLTSKRNSCGDYGLLFYSDIRNFCFTPFSFILSTFFWQLFKSYKHNWILKRSSIQACSIYLKISVSSIIVVFLTFPPFLFWAHYGFCMNCYPTSWATKMCQSSISTWGVTYLLTSKQIVNK